jgi:hypothetical protein
MPTLFCRPVNGLGNRIMTAVSCLRLAKKWGYNFHLVWPFNNGELFSVPFKDLFETEIESSGELPTGILIHNLSHQPEIQRKTYARPLSGENVLIDGWKHFCIDTDDIGLGLDTINEEIKKELNLFMRPSKKVITISEALGYDFYELYSFGVHIRKGALEWDGIAETCSTEEILKIYEHIASQLPIESMFITGSSTTDNIKFLLGLQNKNVKVKLSPAASFESSLESHCIAIADFLALSNCTNILKMGNSSYSATAALMGGRKLFTIHPVGYQGLTSLSYSTANPAAMGRAHSL